MCCVTCCVVIVTRDELSVLRALASTVQPVTLPIDLLVAMLRDLLYCNCK